MAEAVENRDNGKRKRPMFRGLSWLIILAALLPAPSAAQRRRLIDARGSANLDELARQVESHQRPAGPPREVIDPERTIHGGNTANAALHLPRAAATPPPTAANVAPVYTGFQALLDNFAVIPPDTNGAVSPQYVVTMLNSQVLIQSRDGAFRSNYPINLGGRSGFWSAVTISNDVFDPNIAYDATSDRWIASAAVDAQKASSALVVGVSQTGDPGGNWNMYKIAIGGAGNWGDYPVLGFNGNWVVVSVNYFAVKNNNYVNTTLYVFSKSDLFQNGKATYVTFSDQNGEFIPAADYDHQPGTLYLMRAFAGDVGIHNGVGTIEISKLQGSVGAETFAAGNGGQILFNDPWSDAGADGADFAPQLGSPKKIDAGDSRLQNCVLRAATIWCAQTIFLPLGAPNRAAVQWFQVDPKTQQILQRGRIDDPAATYFYAYPSISVNRNNDALLAFNRFSASDYPSARFCFRLATDPLNTMEPDLVLKAGEATYVAPAARSGSNRWGDFSRTWTDPVDDLAFWTIQEYAVSPTAVVSGQFGTWWSQVQAPSVVQGQPPTLAPQGIGNAASYQGPGVAPGELITLFGDNLGPAALQKPLVSSSGVVDTIAGGTRVLFDGVPATMIYASQHQVAAVTPFSLQGKTATQIQLTYLGVTSNTMTLPVVSGIPGIFTLDSSGHGQGAILNQDGSRNSTANPAARGSVIAVYSTGGGAMPGAVDGVLAPQPPPFIQVNQPYTATVGGLVAQALYAGLAPGIVTGVLQVNVLIPLGATPGGAVPVTITVGGVQSPAGVTVAIY